MKTGLLITTYNRPEYLKKCLDSLRQSDLSLIYKIIVVDDHSSDIETISILTLSGFDVVFKSSNRGICDSIVTGFDILVSHGCDQLINIDGDSIVKNNFVEKILSLPDEAKIKTGFNCQTKNRDGSDRHKIIKQGEKWNVKASVGGINMSFTSEVYLGKIRDVILDAKERKLNWDHRVCLELGGAISTQPSVVQHIGFDSSMGHTEPPDVACDFFSLSIPDVTLIGVDCSNVSALIKAADYSVMDIQFGAVKLLSSMPSKDERVIKIAPIKSKQEYSKFIIKELNQFIKTSHALIIQHDGYVVDWRAWNPEWLQWDYIGASWWYKDGMNVGNGGFSLRSKKLMNILEYDKEIKIFHPEDHIISRVHRKRLEEMGIKFAPEDVANRFAIEAYNVPAPDNKYGGQFGFHGGNVDFKGTNHGHINVNVRRR